MKKIAAYLGIALACIVVIVITLHLAWYFQKSKPLNIYILDKTVTQTDRIEHKSLVWLLNHFRIVGPDGKSYNHKSDYWGFFPIDLNQQLFDIKSIRLNEVDVYATVYDAAYYADCYGVYSYEWYKTETKTPNSSKVYGGLNQNDYLLLKRMKELNKLIIGEYNMFSSPTNALIRTKTEELFNVTWTGWAGKYCPKLGAINNGKGPAEWMIKLYEKQHQKPWPSKGSGIILISNDGLIDILEDGVDLKIPKVKVVVEAAMPQWANNPKDTEFYGWFDIILAGSGSEVYATFKLETTQAGEEKLTAYGLKNRFPAVVRGYSKKFCYYLAGDFAENDVNLFTSKLKGGKTFNKLLHFDSPKSPFFNDFYLPLIGNIISHYTDNLM